ncbi:MAG: valine--tRNA ligase, partial [Desertifilum sp. SIO1I2]|nr:valine--tRNA ligase [Desertifilum sp. SIO1I2]
INAIRTIRNLRAELEIKPSAKVPAILQTENPSEQQTLEVAKSYIEDLGKVDSLTLTATVDPKLGKTMAGVAGTVQILIPLAGVVDIEALKAKLSKDLGKIEAEMQSISNRLNNPGFVSKAPVEVVQSARDTVAELQKQAEILRDRLSYL